jgi:hypothetical protein
LWGSGRTWKVCVEMAGEKGVRGYSGQGLGGMRSVVSWRGCEGRCFSAGKFSGGPGRLTESNSLLLNGTSKGVDASSSNESWNGAPFPSLERCVDGGQFVSVERAAERGRSLLSDTSQNGGDSFLLNAASWRGANSLALSAPKNGFDRFCRTLRRTEAIHFC